MSAENFITVRRDDVLAKLPTVTFTMRMACEVYSSEYRLIKSGKKALISTGIKINLPPHYHATLAGGHHVDKFIEVHPACFFHGGETIIRVLLENRGTGDFAIHTGEVLAYLFIEPMDDVR